MIGGIAVPLSEVKALNLPRMVAEDIGIRVQEGTDDREGAEAMIAEINEYLKVFVKPTVTEDKGTGFMFSNQKCVCCGNSLGGVLGTFQWGLCHGEGYCSTCKWPARALHDIQVEGGSLFNRPVDRILQYHPDELKEND